MKERSEKDKLKRRRLIGRIIAAIIAIIMLLATASTFVFYIINNV